MPESGVIYTFPDDFLEKVPSLIARAGIALEVLPPTELAGGCEGRFLLRMRRDKGTVELSGYCDVDKNKFIMGFGWGWNPFRWSWDEKLFNVVRELLTQAGMKRFSAEVSGDSQTASGHALPAISNSFDCTKQSETVSS